MLGETVVPSEVLAAAPVATADDPRAPAGPEPEGRGGEAERFSSQERRILLHLVEGDSNS